MTPEEAAHHEWLSEIRYQRPKIVDRSGRSPTKVKSTKDETDNDYGMNSYIANFFYKINLEVFYYWVM